MHNVFKNYITNLKKELIKANEFSIAITEYVPANKAGIIIEKHYWFKVTIS